MPILCHSDDIAEGKSKGFQLDDTFLFAVKKNNEIFLYQNSCPHLGIQLEWQEDQFLDIEGTMIQCSSHGALFRIEDGVCLLGPCLGRSLTPVEFTLKEGLIEIS